MGAGNTLGRSKVNGLNLVSNESRRTYTVGVSGFMFLMQETYGPLLVMIPPFDLLVVFVFPLQAWGF